MAGSLRRNIAETLVHAGKIADPWPVFGDRRKDQDGA